MKGKSRLVLSICVVFCYSCNNNSIPIQGDRKEVVKTDIIICGSNAFEISFFENDTLVRKGLYVGEDTSLPYSWHTFYSEKEIKKIEYFPPCLENQFYKMYRDSDYSHVNNIIRLHKGDTIVYPREGLCNLVVPSKKLYLGDTFFAYFEIRHECFDTNFFSGYFSIPYDSSKARMIIPAFEDKIIRYSYQPSKVGWYTIECLIREDNVHSPDEEFKKTGLRDVRDYYFNLDFEVFNR